MKPDRLTTYYDAFNLVAGEWMGSGIHRWVYDCPLRPDLVAKVEFSDQDDLRRFANVNEWTFWQDNRDYKPVAQWLAPCEFLSPDGRILLQKRCTPLGVTEKLPDKLPTFLTDIKRSNFGKLDGRLVCMDYATTIGNPSVRLRKVRWND